MGRSSQLPSFKKSFGNRLERFMHRFMTVLFAGTNFRNMLGQESEQINPAGIEVVCPKLKTSAQFFPGSAFPSKRNTHGTLIWLDIFEFKRYKNVLPLREDRFNGALKDSSTTVFAEFLLAKAGLGDNGARPISKNQPNPMALLR